MMTARNVKSLRRSPSRKPFRAGKLRLRRCWETLEVLQLPAGLVPLLTHVSEENHDNESNNTDPAPEGPQGTSHPCEHVNTRHPPPPPDAPHQAWGLPGTDCYSCCYCVLALCGHWEHVCQQADKSPYPWGFHCSGGWGRRSEINNYIGEGRGGRWVVSVCGRGERGWWNFEPISQEEMCESRPGEKGSQVGIRGRASHGVTWSQYPALVS